MNLRAKKKNKYNELLVGNVLTCISIILHIPISLTVWTREPLRNAILSIAYSWNI